MKKYTAPLVKEVELCGCDHILTTSTNIDYVNLLPSGEEFDD